MRRDFATKADLAEGFYRMQRTITVGVVAICGVIVGLIPIMLVLR